MTDEMTAVYVDYYSFDNNGTKTIAIKANEDGHGFVVLGNGGVALWWLSDDNLSQVARLCIRKGITINPTIVH